MSAGTAARASGCVSMAATIAPVRDPRTRTQAAGARARARDRAAAATRRIPSRLLAEHWGVSSARARHLRSEGNAVSSVFDLIADPRIPDDEASRIVGALLQSYEERFLFRPTEDLRARLAQLRNEDEHRLEAAQNRATVCNSPDRIECYVAHASALLEMATIDGMLE